MKPSPDHRPHRMTRAEGRRPDGGAGAGGVRRAVVSRLKRLSTVGLLALLATCQTSLRPDRDAEIAAALSDLRVGGFSFAADVRVRADPYAVCDGLACANLKVVRGRRTIGLAREAFSNPSRLRASLLEIWDRYQEPRPGAARDLARAALLVVSDGPRVGVTDRRTLRLAYHGYRQLWLQLSPSERAGLLNPDQIPLP